MSTIDKHLKTIAQNDLPSEMQQVFGMLEAAYTYVMDLNSLVPRENNEAIQIATGITRDLYSALEYGSRMLSIKAQIAPVSPERAIHAMQYATQMLNEARQKMSAIAAQFTQASTQALYEKVIGYVDRALQRMSQLQTMVA